MTNFSKKELKTYITRSLLALLGFCFALLLIVNIIPVVKIYSLSKSIKTNLNTFQTQLEKKDIKNSLTTAKIISKNAKDLRNNVNNLKILNYLPGVSDNINSIDNLSEILSLSINSYIEIYPAIEKNINVFTKDGGSKIISLPKSEKAKIISSISESSKAINNIDKNVERIIYLIDENKKNKGVIKPINDIWKKIDGQYSNIKLIEKFLPVVKALPEILGTPKDAKYLLLFQNNTELRPTGGFIGTYGTVTVSNGEIGEIFTDNIYNLDRSSASRLKIEPPKPLKDYLKIQYLYLRDANFNPDYQESAKYIADLYKKESQNQSPIAGVIAITPDVLQSVIGYFGEVEAMGLKFNKENSTDLLNYETKFGYWQDKNMDVSQRKIVIQKLADVLFEKIKALSLTDLKNFAYAISDNLDKKQMLLYFNNKDAQNFVAQNNWAGKFIDSTNSDYFSVVDTNVLSGKSEPYMTKNLDYDLKMVGNDLIATLSLTYKLDYNKYLENDIYQDDPGYLQEYKSYTRIYVPSGSWLNSIQKNDGAPTRNNIDFKDESGKASFGFYLVIPKNTTTTYKLEYKLSKELALKFKNEYSLIYQKQAGLYGNKLNINIDINKSIKSYTVTEQDGLSINSYNKKFNLNGYADNDKKIDIKFYSDSDMSYLKQIIKQSYLSFNKENTLGN